MATKVKEQDEWHKFITLTRHSDHSPVILRCDKIRSIDAASTGKTLIKYGNIAVYVTESLVAIEKKKNKAIPVRKANQ